MFLIYTQPAQSPQRVSLKLIMLALSDTVGKWCQNGLSNSIRFRLN